MLALVLLCLTPSLGDTSRPPTSVRDVAAAWVAAGAEPGWMGRREESPELVFVYDRAELVGESALPAFHFRQPTPAVFDRLPAPAGAFGLMIHPKGTDAVFGPDVARALARFDRLAALAVGNVKAGVGSFAPFGRAGRLERLKLDGIDLDDATLAEACLPSLTWFETTSLSRVSPRGLTAIAKMRSLRCLRIDVLGDYNKAFVTGRDYTPPDITTLLKSLTRLETVSLSRVSVTADALKLLASSGNLRSLGVSNTDFPAGGMKHLASAGRLARLDLSCSSISDADLAGLVRLPRLTRLTTDRLPFSVWKRFGGLLPLLQHLEVTAEGDDDLGVLALLPRLTRLGVKGGEGGATLRRLSAIKSLRVFEIHTGTVGGAEMKEIAGLTGVRVLRLSSSGIDAAGLRRLAALAALEDADIRSAPLTDDGAAALARLPSLRRLAVSGESLTDAGLASLAKCRGLTSFVIFHDGKFTDDGVRHLASLPRLSTLWLHCDGVTDRGLKALAGVRSLTAALVQSSEITDAGLEPLERLRGLRRLFLPGTRVTEGGAKSLGRRLPRCEVVGPYE